MLLLFLITISLLTGCSDSASQAHPSARVLTSGPQDFWPCFSPDGTHILFSRHEKDSWKLYLVAVSGGPPQPFSQDQLPVSATRANWSSRTNQVAFTGVSENGDSKIWIINGNGTNSHEVTVSGLSNQVFYPSWYPSGDQIAAMDAQEMVIKRLDVSTGAIFTVTDQKKLLTGMPSVSPNGQQIAFAGQKNEGQKYDQTKNIVWIADENGDTHSLEANPAQGRAPTWSPDGKRLAFESNRGSRAGLYAIYLINVDGTGLVQVTDPDLNADHPVWSPDGRQLAFSARSSMWLKGRSIWVIGVPR